MIHLLQGLVIGFAVAAPVGPVGLLCIRRSILDGRTAGFVTGLGAAVADAIFGLVAALGLTTVTTFLSGHAHAFQLAGGFFLLAIGLTTLRSRPPQRETGSVHAPNLAVAFASTVAITLANPMTIAGFVGIFTGFGVGLQTTGARPVGWLVFGVFLGSASWWLVLSTAASWFARRLNDGGLRIINLVAGGAIAAFGLWQLGRLVLNQN
jgi:threonine/homoserine/homoserine lactone efflux protein